MKLTDEVLRQAVGEVQTAILNSLPDETLCKHVFSPRFEKKMQKLLMQEAHPVRRQVKRYVAAVAALVFVGTASWLSIDGQARAGLCRWIDETCGTQMLYRFYGDTDALGEYRLGGLPEGYREAGRMNGEDERSVVYQNGNGDFFIFYYGKTQSGAYMTVDTKGATVIPITIGKYKGEIYLYANDEMSNTVTWFDEKEQVYFSLSAFMDQETIIELAESVEKIK